ncbi:glycosyltransferase family protein [Camelimonas abortus]|uniref:Glycosyltransferase family protein n=1 Tax=Camelimonas abortus TaxID=1017184 RepID=A0ABV7LF72_9HYPH
MTLEHGARAGALSRGNLSGARVLIYSHDTFGLGHLRRSRAIANALAAEAPGVSVIIASGSPVIGSFEFGPGVDFVRIPGVVKLANGDYRTLNLNMGLEETAQLRAAIIRQTADSFRPDLVIVDKEPTGFRGEVTGALELARARGARVVLGVRDVMDDPALLAPEWERKGALRALADYYDDIWVYGLREIYEPLAAFDLPARLRERTLYTGYLRRTLPEEPQEPQLARYPKITRGPFILVTSGGGADGDDMVDWVISAYEADPTLETPALVVFGPFIARERRRQFMRRISRHPRLAALSFDSKLETLMHRAAAVVAMGGYNTFCELLSFDRPALIVPRTRPRREQYIRARAAERLGLASCIVEENGERDPRRMAAALHRLPQQNPPSRAWGAPPGLLEGASVIRADFRNWLRQRRGGAGQGEPAAAVAFGARSA